MISTVTHEDTPAIRELITACVSHSIPLPATDSRWLLDGIMKSLERWRSQPHEFRHLKYASHERILGVMLLNDGWNLVNLFVHPDYQHRGIGRALVEAGVDYARTSSDRGYIRLNSSSVAVEFYEKLGFVQTGPGKDRPGGCVPMELTL